MTLGELKRKVFALIEELDVNKKELTADPDLALKINDVVCQVLYEVARHKKIPKYVEFEVHAGDLISFEDIEKAVGYPIYQVSLFSGVDYEPKANNTIFKITESGTAEVDCFVFPEHIDHKTKDNFELELSPDVLEVAVYGIAADILKADVSTEYGSIYATRYESMKQTLDPRHAMNMVTVVGGIYV